MNMWGILLYLKYVHIVLSSDDRKGLQRPNQHHWAFLRDQSFLEKWLILELTSQFQKASTGQRWNNLSFINDNDWDGLKLIKYV